MCLFKVLWAFVEKRQQAIFTTHSKLCKVLFLVLSVCEIFLELLNGFAPNSLGRRVLPSLGRVWMSRSNVKVTRDKFPPHCKCIVTRSLQITSISGRWDHCVAARGWS